MQNVRRLPVLAAEVEAAASAVAAAAVEAVEAAASEEK